MEKPKKETVETLDLGDVLSYLEAHGHEGIYDKVWDYYCDQGVIQNGGTFNAYFGDETNFDDEIKNELLLIKEIWDIKDRMRFYTSW